MFEWRVRVTVRNFSLEQCPREPCERKVHDTTLDFSWGGTNPSGGRDKVQGAFERRSDWAQNIAR